MSRATGLLIRASFVCSLALWLVAMVLPRTMWTVFTSDAALLDLAASKTRLCFAVLLTGGIQYAHVYVIKFLGKVRMSLFLGVLKRLLILLPCIFILPTVLPCDKETAVFLALPVSEGLAFAVTALCYWQVMRDVLRNGKAAK